MLCGAAGPVQFGPPVTDQRPPAEPAGPAPQRLDSWKDIAAYLSRDVSTVQRWEKREGMPVHRHLHDKLGSVYAFPAELDEWARSRRQPDPQPVAGEEGVAAPAKRSRFPLVAAVIALLAIAVAAAAYWLLARRTAAGSNPIAAARFVRVTDFEGSEDAAVISRDGRFVAFLSDRDGAMDVWLTQAGSGQFRNLTGGKLRELVNPDIRMLGFSPDGTLVTFWVRRDPRPDISIWAVPTLGGEPRLYLEGAAELDWSRDGSRVVYHTPAPGDPMFIRDTGGGAPRPLFAAAAGVHNHFPVWSPDDELIYFVSGAVPVHQDVWRIRAAGGKPERMTSHDTRVGSLTFADKKTLLYLATDASGDGPWLYALDVQRRQSRRVSFGTERYGSLSGSSDGRRLAVTVANPRRTLWRVPIANDKPATEAQRVSLPVVGARSPRAARDYLLCVSSRDGGESLWKFAAGTPTELWSAPGARIAGGPAISLDGRRIAFTAEQKNVRRLYVMNADGSGLRVLPESVKPRGAPAWSPDATSLAVPVIANGATRLARIDVAAQTASTLRAEFASDPVWSPDGASILYSGPEVGTTFPIRVTALDGRLRPGRELVLSRGIRRIVFLPGRNAVVALRGDMVHKNFWAIDLDTGRETQLTNFESAVIGDFDVSPDGHEIVFDREQDSSDVVLIERP